MPTGFVRVSKKMIRKKYYDENAAGGGVTTPPAQPDKETLQKAFDQGFAKGQGKAFEKIEKLVAMTFDEFEKAYPTMQTEFEELKDKQSGVTDTEIKYQKLEAKQKKTSDELAELHRLHKDSTAKTTLEKQLVTPLKKAGLIGDREEDALYIINGRFKPRYDDITESVSIEGFESVDKFIDGFKKTHSDFFSSSNVKGIVMDGVPQNQPSQSLSGSVFYEGMSARDASITALAGAIKAGQPS